MSIDNSLMSNLLLLPNPFQPEFLRSQSINCLSNRYFGKPHLVARSQLTDAVHISRNNIGNFRIAARSLLINKQDNRLAILRNLDGAQRDTVGQQLSLRALHDGLSFEPQTRAVRLLAH